MDHSDTIGEVERKIDKVPENVNQNEREKVFCVYRCRILHLNSNTELFSSFNLSILYLAYIAHL